MVEASTQFKKSGFSDEDSAQLAQVSALYQNIADSELSAGESASFIISQMKAFNYTADESIHVFDVINQTANNFAVSTDDLQLISLLETKSNLFKAFGDASHLY